MSEEIKKLIVRKPIHEAKYEAGNKVYAKVKQDLASGKTVTIEYVASLLAESFKGLSENPEFEVYADMMVVFDSKFASSGLDREAEIEDIIDFEEVLAEFMSGKDLGKYDEKPLVTVLDGNCPSYGGKYNNQVLVTYVKSPNSLVKCSKPEKDKLCGAMGRNSYVLILN